MALFLLRHIMQCNNDFKSADDISHQNAARFLSSLHAAGDVVYRALCGRQWPGGAGAREDLVSTAEVGGKLVKELSTGLFSLARAVLGGPF